MNPTKPDGYLAESTIKTGQAVLILHAWWGLNDTIKAFCDRLAEAGFIAFAPDLYDGKVTNQISEAESFAMAMDEHAEQTREILDKALTFLQAQVGSEDAKIAVIGFSLGAYYALDLSANAPEDIQSVVIFYGTGPADFSKSKADYLGHFAETDEFEPQSNVDYLEESLKRAGRPVTFYHYEDTGHWFFEPDRVDAYNQEAASLAWNRTIDFLKRSPIL